MTHASPRRQYRWEVTNDVAPSVYFGLDRKLCGIYTLEFAGGERYVGQTVDLASRLASHRRTWQDIVAVAFFECAADELNQLERTLITQTERSFPVRNKAFTRMPSGDAEIDLVVDRQQQAEWLDGVQPAYPLDERTRAADRRRRTRKKFEKAHRASCLRRSARGPHRVRARCHPPLAVGHRRTVLGESPHCPRPPAPGTGIGSSP